MYGISCLLLIPHLMKSCHDKKAFSRWHQCLHLAKNGHTCTYIHCEHTQKSIAAKRLIIIIIMIFRITNRMITITIITIIIIIMFYSKPDLFLLSTITKIWPLTRTSSLPSIWHPGLGQPSEFWCNIWQHNINRFLWNDIAMVKIYRC